MKHSNKVFLLAISFLSLCCYIKADEAKYYLHIDQKDGSATITLELAKQPVIEFSDGKMMLSGGDILCDLSNIDKWFFDQKEEPTPTNINAKTNEQRISYHDNIFSVSGITERELKVFDAKGINQSPNTNYSGNTATVDFNNLPNGVYIIKIGTQSYKVNKK